MKNYSKINLISFLSIVAFSSLTSSAYASDFNIPFVNAAGLGELYSGWAASAEDASTAIMNPAGLTKIGHEQLALSALGLTGSSKFTGTSTNPLFPAPPLTGTASTKLRGFIPTFYYASKPYRNIVFGFGASSPFALGSNYAKDSIVRYAATRSQILVLDVGPSFGVQVNDRLSVGGGLDLNRITFTLNQMYGPPLSFPDAEGQNHLRGWGTGWHAGLLYQASSRTRVGLSHNSMVMYHTQGDSVIYLPSGALRTTGQRANAALPARTQLSVTQDIGSRLTAMATVFYTNWRTLQQLTLQNTMTPLGMMSITIPFNYHNTFDYALGLKYNATDKVMLRTGAMFLSTPTNNRNRTVGNPLGTGVVLGVGVHYQQTPSLGMDFAYARGIFKDTQINFTTPLVALSGTSSQNTNVVSTQLTWNIT